MYRVRMLEQKEVTKVEYNEVTEMVSFHVKDPDNGWEGEHRVRAVKLNAAHNDGVDLAEYITGDLWLFIDICWLDELVDQYELWWCSENIDTVDCGPDDEDGEEERFWAHTMDEEQKEELLSIANASDDEIAKFMDRGAELFDKFGNLKEGGD